MPVVRDRRPRRHDLCVVANIVLGLCAHVAFKQIGIAIKVIEIFKQCKIERGFDMFVADVLRQKCRQVNSKLLIAYRRFKQIFIQRFQP